jgi:hypothetical protein
VLGADRQSGADGGEGAAAVEAAGSAIIASDALLRSVTIDGETRKAMQAQSGSQAANPPRRPVILAAVTIEERVTNV